ncbi:hypothetical protein [Spirillospora sp. NBC_01491]|nr:hypothetical protein [Spirillospora sp. NBC_01491]
MTKIPPPEHSSTWPHGEKPAERPDKTTPPGCREVYDRQMGGEK